MEHIDEEEYNKNPVLSEILKSENDLKNMLVQYVGKKLNPKDQNITVEMVIDVMAMEFPEFLLAIAEENFVRGYQQALDDVDSTKKIIDQKDEKQKNCKLCESQE
jgi:hypothetical protein